jgi:hypothetical protein
MNAPYQNSTLLFDDVGAIAELLQVFKR